MTEYVVVLPIRWNGDGHGFADKNVLLVLKDKPAWQKGRLNLVGGKIEPGETPEQAAVRELKEESGLSATHDTDPDWGGPQVCGKILGVDCVIYCLNCNVAIGPNTKISPREGETEHVAWYPWSTIKDDPRLMPNLRVIIPMLFMDSRGWILVDNASSTRQMHSVIRRAAETAAACGCRVGTPTRQGLPCGGSRPT